MLIIIIGVKLKFFLIYIIFNFSDAINSATTGKCQNTCGSETSTATKKYYVRAPGSSTVTSLCNVLCDPNYKKCHNLDSNKVLDLNTNYICKSSYDRVAYNCILKTDTAKCNLKLFNLKF